MGVTVETLKPGDGKRFPKKEDNVTVHYVGRLVDGTVFDSSRERNKPFTTQIGMGNVIRGWDEGIPQLSVGQIAKLTISADYGYGTQGFGSVIPPHSTLIFEVELIGINQ